ncbi:acyl carrier protein [Paenibacillus sp. 481]|uniref:acyl carrier protein n=1 Tax=Paenibacillus sp. 481 TaxID=2835869 RepID=UPI001E46CA0D|nr:acyl carrier protein [Paenibacillus sp. 481]UHA72032.1 acyl carrier protein [Paenibacillus sp. 481]
MTEQTMKATLRTIISDVTEINDYENDEKFNERLGVDSMMIIEIAVRIEKAFNITVPEHYLPRLTNLDETHLAINELVYQLK